ncbi:H-NS family nucleoid-associated regulatory protein [Hafnia paralvei]|uniref:H-NS family histone-like protein n=1 Tax=Hafnia paralvei TaxID=546367 RepID=UPI002FDBC771
MSIEDNYDAVRKVLSNQRSIRAFVRECDYEWLVEACEKLNAATQEKRSDYEAELKQREERERKRQELLALIQEEGFDVESLINPTLSTKTKGKKKSTGVPRKAKYQYVENGETKTWAGVGRKPKFIADALEAGRSLDEFLIPDQQ